MLYTAPTVTQETSRATTQCRHRTILHRAGAYQRTKHPTWASVHANLHARPRANQLPAQLCTQLWEMRYPPTGLQLTSVLDGTDLR